MTPDVCITGGFDMTILWYYLTRYVSIIFIAILFLWEIHEIILSWINEKQLVNYLTTLNNYTDWIILCTSTSFFIFGETTEAGGHILGWSLFFIYMDVTLHLAHNRWIGQYIYMALCIIKSMGLSLIIFLPTFCGFAFAFHSFILEGIFRTSVLAFFKTNLMLLGEFDFNDDFEHQDPDDHYMISARVNF